MGPAPDLGRCSRTMKQNLCSRAYRKSQTCFCGWEDQRGGGKAGRMLSLPKMATPRQMDPILMC